MWRDFDNDFGEDLLRLVVEIKGYRGEDAKDKKDTIETYWVPGLNNLGGYGRWGFVELREIYTLERDFTARVERAFGDAIAAAIASDIAERG